jgi:hypothetical protein
MAFCLAYYLTDFRVNVGACLVTWTQNPDAMAVVKNDHCNWIIIFGLFLLFLLFLIYLSMRFLLQKIGKTF